MAVLDVEVQEYKIDYQDGVTENLTGISNPLGMAGKRLEAWSHVLIARRDVLEVINAACKLSGIKKHRITSSSLASAKALLSSDDLNRGVCLLDIGGEYTSIIVYKAGQLVYTASMPWGGNYLTSCIALHLGVDRNEAEKFKIDYSDRGVLDPIEVSILMVKKIGELFSMLNSELNKMELNLPETLGAGIVLTGGTSRQSGLSQLVDIGSDLPGRRGVFQDADCLDKVPLEYASAVGLALHMEVVK